MPVEVIEAINTQNKNVGLKKKSDIQVAGMLAFFVLTKGEHPFGGLSHERMTNILKGNPVNLAKLDSKDKERICSVPINIIFVCFVKGAAVIG